MIGLTNICINGWRKFGVEDNLLKTRPKNLNLLPGFACPKISYYNE
jgi:hypothetical protein